MRRVRAIAVSSLILAAAGPVYPNTLPLPTSLNVLGVVTNAARPVERALVIALNLNTLEARQTFSARDGAFALPLLPAAVYRVIAVKQGFAPAMAMIVPTRSDFRLSLRLPDGKKAAKNTNQVIWELRGSLPPDILRELDMAMAPAATAVASSPTWVKPCAPGKVTCSTGISRPITSGRTGR